MKKKLFNYLTLTAFVFFAGLYPNLSFGQVIKTGQVECSIGLHEAFGPVSDKKPVVLNRLGTSPQFGEIPYHTAQSAYDHLKKVHTRNLRGARAEMDNFLKVLGYTGLLDPALTLDKIVPVVLPKGKVGWMGAYSRGYQYRWSVLGNPFETFKIVSRDGTCHAYIMKKCGNAFYDPTEAEDCIPCTECDPNHTDKSICPDCVTQELSFAGTGTLNTGDVINTARNLPVVGTYNGRKLCLGEQQVPVRLTYELIADGKVDYSKTFQVCDYGIDRPTSLNMPVQFNYSVAETGYNLSNQLEIPLTKKQFNQLKRSYNECPTELGDISLETITTSGNKVESYSTGTPATALGTVTSADCIKQTVTVTGNGEVANANVVSNNIPVTVIGRYVKDGKLKKGETADKYRCLGTFNLPANSMVAYNLSAESKAQHFIELCDTGDVNSEDDFTANMNVNTTFVKQDLMVGDYNKIYIPLTKQEYKRVSKLYQRCCGDDTTKCF